MSKAEIITINLGDAFDLRSAGTTNWTTERDAAAADTLGNLNPGGGNDFIEMGVLFDTSRGNAWNVKRAWLGFDTSAVTIPPEKAEISVMVGNKIGIGSNPTNLATDHKFTLVGIKGHNIKQRDVTLDISRMRFVAANGDFSSGVGGTGYFSSLGIAGWSSGASWASSYVPYSDLKDVSLFSTSTTENVVTFTLNKQARLDIATCDHFYLCMIDYTYDLLNVDPSTGSPSAGASSGYVIAIPNNTYSARGDNFVIPKLSFTAGGREAQTPTKKRIDDKFTINGFSDITDQRKAYTREGNLLDQVPFQLGIKGPLSLRGRQNDKDGTPLTTAGPPKVTS